MPLRADATCDSWDGELKRLRKVILQKTQGKYWLPCARNRASIVFVLKRRKTMTDIALKIKRLLELAAKNNTEGEAASAMAKVQELMAKYNLDMAQIDATDDPGQDLGFTDAEDIAAAKRVKESHKRGAMYEYQQQLWATVASVNYCWHWTIPVQKSVNGRYRVVTRHHYLVGREANVVSAKLMGDYLEEAINRLCPYKGKLCLSRSAISWKEGVASRLRVRLYERYQEMEKQSVAAQQVDSMALTLGDVREREHNANFLLVYGKQALDDMLRRREERKKAVEETIAAEPEKPETEAAKRKRQAAARRASEKADRQEQRYWDRRDLSAWHNGRTQGNDISLDGQVSEGKGDRAIEK